MIKLMGVLTVCFLVVASSSSWAASCTYGGKTYSEGAIVNEQECTCDGSGCRWT